ncbi:MAG: hypothetical protein IPF57_11765 [Gammaproteobacteria bacterium]|nr:hypothetical protein [Gammaproteobacteria bacterium]MBK9467996.1 hypothetical protein [Gammaproteobacteria bacterium]MBP7910242.1 hypothetical protein [Pseudomonadales bacterium]
MHESDHARLSLVSWAKWQAAGKPLHFSPYGESIGARDVFIPKNRRRFRTDEPLWQESEEPGEIDAAVAELMKIDSRLHGALSDHERRVLLAAVVPLGRPAPAAERAVAAGVDVDTLRAIRRRALALIG